MYRQAVPRVGGNFVKLVAEGILADQLAVLVFGRLQGLPNVLKNAAEQPTALRHSGRCKIIEKRLRSSYDITVATRENCMYFFISRAFRRQSQARFLSEFLLRNLDLELPDGFPDELPDELGLLFHVKVIALVIAQFQDLIPRITKFFKQSSVHLA